MMYNFLKKNILLTVLFSLVPAVVFSKDYVLYTPSGGDFKIPSSNGKILDTKKLRGSNLLIIFGFTKCPSICPFVLNRLKTLRTELTADERKQTQVIFISVDNQRDTLTSINTYATAFDPDFLSGTDTDVKLKKILQKFGARFHRFKTKNAALLVDHTSDIYVVNKKGIWTDSLKAEASIDEIKKSLTRAETINSNDDRFPKTQALQILSHGKKICDVTVKDCIISLASDKYQISLQGRPIRSLKEFTISVVKLNESNAQVPVEIDFQGVDLSMGYIRPQLIKHVANEYAAHVTLPVCELPSMKWQLTLILKDKNNKLIGTHFNLSSAE